MKEFSHGTALLTALPRRRTEYETILRPLAEDWNETQALECLIADAVRPAYGLTAADIALMWETAPSRMPGAAAEEDDDAEEAA